MEADELTSEKMVQPGMQELVASSEPVISGQNVSSNLPWFDIIKIALLVGILGVVVKKA